LGKLRADNKLQASTFFDAFSDRVHQVTVRRLCLLGSFRSLFLPRDPFSRTEENQARVRALIGSLVVVTLMVFPAARIALECRTTNDAVATV